MDGSTPMHEQSNRVRFENSWLEIRSGIRHLRLNEADHYRTGYAFGRLMQMSDDPILRLLKHRFLGWLVSFAAFVSRRFFANIRIPECYLDEIRGYADSTGIPYAQLYFMNFCFDVLKKFGFHCSTLVFFNPKAVLIGRNTDLHPWLAALALRFTLPTVTDVSIPGKHRFSQVSIPFFVGALNGFNQSGIAVNSHQIIHVRETADGPRLATPLLMRMLLEQANDLAGAEALVRQNPTLRSLNVVVTSETERRAVVFEVNPAQVNALSEAGGVCCATHFASTTMGKLHDGPIGTSQARQASMLAMMAENRQPDAPALIGMLQDQRNGPAHRTSGRSLTNHGTFQSFLFDLTHRRILVSNGLKRPVSLSGEFIAVDVNGAGELPAAWKQEVRNEPERQTA
jgi:predicted choloylglycine hydrolase